MHDVESFFAIVRQMDFAAFESQKRSSALRDVAIIIDDKYAQVRWEGGRPDRLLGRALRPRHRVSDRQNNGEFAPLARAIAGGKDTPGLKFHQPSDQCEPNAQSTSRTI